MRLEARHLDFGYRGRRVGNDVDGLAVLTGDHQRGVDELQG